MPHHVWRAGSRQAGRDLRDHLPGPVPPEGGRRDAPGLRLIGAIKLASGLAIGAAGLGIFRLMDGGLGGPLEHVALRLHLDPENRLVHATIARLAGIDRTHLEAIGVGTFFYAALHVTEGTGLLLRRRWAGYLTIVATASLLPPESFEMARKFSPLRAGVLAANLAILAFVIARLRLGPRSGSRPPARDTIRRD